MQLYILCRVITVEFLYAGIPTGRPGTFFPHSIILKGQKHETQCSETINLVDRRGRWRARLYWKFRYAPFDFRSFLLVAFHWLWVARAGNVYGRALNQLYGSARVVAASLLRKSDFIETLAEMREFCL
jgi:hypothetical protein